MSQFPRNNVATLKRNRSVDESAPFEAETSVLSESEATTAKAAIPSSDIPPSSDRSGFREGFMHGRWQSIRDSEQLAVYFARRDRAAATRGLALGLLLASVVGGAIAALAYFEVRLDSLTPERAPVQLLPLPDRALPDRTLPESEAPVQEQAPAQSPSDREAVPEEPLTPEIPSATEDIPAPETSERSSFSSDLPLGQPPMGGPYAPDLDSADAPVASPPAPETPGTPVSVTSTPAAIA